MERNEAPIFLRLLDDTQVREGEPTTFDCDFRAHPEAEVTWYFNGRKITHSSSKYRIHSDDHHSRLTVMETTQDDTGEFTVDIRNVAGTKKSSAKLTVKPAPRDFHVVRGEAPRILERLNDLEIMAGYDVGLTCKITGDPKPRIQWLFERKVITSFSEKIQMVETEHGKTFMLIIKDVTTADLGKKLGPKSKLFILLGK